MTYRQLIVELLRDGINLDAPAQVLVYHRDEKELAVALQRIPISWLNTRGSIGVAVEAVTVTDTPKEKVKS